MSVQETKQSDPGDIQLSTLVGHLGELKPKCIAPAKSFKPNTVMITTIMTLQESKLLSLRSGITSAKGELTLFRTPLRRRQLLQHLVSLFQIG